MTDFSVIIPAYREETVIGSVVENTRRVMEAAGRSFEIIVVDDGSDDGTAAAAESAGARIISHPYNIGNGAAVKTGIRNARGVVLVTMDGDGQHDPQDINRLLEHIDRYDMVVGARTSDSDSAAHRNLANKIYNFFASYICKRDILDLTSGFRAIRADVARRFVALLPNSFSYPTTITMAVVRGGYSLAYVPVTVRRRVGRSKIKLMSDGSRFLLIIIKIATLFSPLRVFLPVSTVMFLGGLGYGIFRIIFMGGRYGPTSSMLMIMGVVVFMVGLVSEQVAQLYYDRSEKRE
ncbi:MAG: glycosyl transferase [delta proteobacterium MLS_D]|jgi:glycosyltransferase involved in cell wall biosynthesis|nr:MAG: glycosyl transferase [delta proteobacterium MLS_D]